MEEFRSLADLLDLQEVDLQIDRLLNERQSLPELERYRRAHDELTGLSDQHDTASQELRETSLALDRTSGELEMTELKLSQEQNRLYAGGMSARDADYLRQEVESIGRRISDMEEKVLVLMEQRETQEKLVDRLTQDRDAARAGKDELEAAISKAWEGLDAKLAVQEAKKADIAALIPEDLMDLYDQLRASKEGVAVGRLADGICGGCHLALTAAEQLEATRSEPPRCIHCRRILVP